MSNTIDNSNLVNLWDRGTAGFTPRASYVYDYSAKTVAVHNLSTIPAGDTLVKTKFKIHDMFGGTVSGEIPVADGDQIVTADVTALNLSKPLALSVVVLTTKGLVADGGAYGLMTAGDVAHWDIQTTAAV